MLPGLQWTRPREKSAILLGAFLLRLCLFMFTSTDRLLTERSELSTPINSFKRLREGLYLYQHGMDPYDGGVNFQPPVLLFFFSMIPQGLYMFLFIFCDCCIGFLICSIASNVGIDYESKLLALYLFNPIVIASCLSKNTQIFTNLSIALSLVLSQSGSDTNSVLALLCASLLSLWPAALMVPLVMLNARNKGNVGDLRTYFSKQVLVSILGLAISCGYTRLGLGSWKFFRAYSAMIQIPDLTPNVGLWWYFFIEMFDSYRPFFLCVATLHTIIYAVPITIRFQAQPLFAFVITMGLIGVFKPYPTVGDGVFTLHCLLLFPGVFKSLRYTFLALSVLLYSVFLGPAFHHLWLYAGSGNANFFYAITLVYNSGLILILTDFIFAQLRTEWEAKNPHVKGKDAVHI